MELLRGLEYVILVGLRHEPVHALLEVTQLKCLKKLRTLHEDGERLQYFFQQHGLDEL